MYLCVFVTAQAIGTRLSELCHSDSESPANILGYIFDEETKRRMRKEDEEEDYLDDSESPNGASVADCRFHKKKTRRDTVESWTLVNLFTFFD